MPTKRSNGVYYVKRRWRGLDPGNPGEVRLVYCSLSTDRKQRATRRENMLETLHANGRRDLVRAFADGDVSIDDLEEAHHTDRTAELAERLKRPDATLAVAVEAALGDKAPDVAESTMERYRTGTGHFRDFVGDDVAVRDALTVERIQEFKAHRLEQGRAKQTVNNDVGAVSVVATYAAKRGGIDERPEVKRYEYEERVRWLDADQVAAYTDALRPRFRTQMRLLMATGMRLGESEALRVADLRLGHGDGRLMVDDAKTPGGVRTVFVPRWAAHELREHVGGRGLAGPDRLFTIGRRIVQREHVRACEAAGVDDYTIHDHRHTAAVHLAGAGMPLHLLQQQLGHKHIEMTMKYAKFNPDYADVEPYFDRVADRLGVANGNGNGCQPGRRQRIRRHLDGSPVRRGSGNRTGNTGHTALNDVNA